MKVNHTVSETDYSRAKCLDLNPEEFSGSGTRAAWDACRACPIKMQCRRDAKAQETFGVYRGGMIFADYGRALPKTPAPRNMRRAKCGTDGGYYRHLRTLNEWPCERCKKAHAEYEQKRNAKDLAGG